MAGSFSSSRFLFPCCKVFFSDQRSMACRNRNLQVEGKKKWERKNQSFRWPGWEDGWRSCCVVWMLWCSVPLTTALQTWALLQPCFLSFPFTKSVRRKYVCVSLLKLIERGCLYITARWEIRPCVGASEVLAAAHKSTWGKQMERSGFCRQGQKRNTQIVAGLGPARLEQKTWNTPLAFKKKCGKLEWCPSSCSQRAMSRQGFHLRAVQQCTTAGEIPCKCWEWWLIILIMLINNPSPFSHRAGGR